MRITSTQYTLQNKSFEIYLSGCNGNPKCEGCYNQELWDFNIGEEYTLEYFGDLQQKIYRFKNIIDNIMILGGEPLDQNINDFSYFIKDMKSFNKDLWLFTRYELNEIEPTILNQFDYVKTGKYIKELSVDNNIQYGIKLATSNQKIYKKGIDY
jgi:anaerobic ribonucleoside-triphosphate reductase activating protein